MEEIRQYQSNIIFLNATMRSKTHINSSKQLERASLQMVYRKCKVDHFTHSKHLPVKKNISTYTSNHRSQELQELLEKRKIEEVRKVTAPPLLDQSLLKRSLYESSSHFSPNKMPKLPDLRAGSVYKQSFMTQSGEAVVKGKQQDGFFMKMPWHDSPNSNYKKSFQKSDRSVSPVERGKAVEGTLFIHKKSFDGKTNYNSSFSPLKNSVLQNSKDCIKSRDHLKGKNCSFSGNSEYNRRFNSLYNKQNLTTIKSIPDKKKGKGNSILPSIKPEQKRYRKEKASKGRKSSMNLMLKKTQSNPVAQNSKELQSTHLRIFGQ